MSEMDLRTLRELIMARTPIWQKPFLNATRLASTSKDLGISISTQSINFLWSLGFIRADLMTGEYEQSDDYRIRFLNEEDASYRLDDRPPSTAIIESLEINTPLRKPCRELSWHPFRMYAIHRLANQLDRGTLPIFAALYHQQTLEPAIRFTKQRTIEQPNFARVLELVDEWNRTCELAILVEPIYLPRIDQRVSYRLGMTRFEFDEQVASLKSEIACSINESAESEFRNIHQELCSAATITDRNSSVHTLMRLGSKQFRDRLKGSLARAVMFKTMAELIRRFAEDKFGVELPEEDECGIGPKNSPESKRLFFGGDRLFDGGAVPKREFLRQFDFDANARVRWYVEGQTELGAMRFALGSNSLVAQTEIVNLHGRVTEKNNLSFIDSLRRDQDEGVVSFILVDNDRSENLRIVRKAAASGGFFGEFYIAIPDFELWNFSIEELTRMCLEQFGSMSPESKSEEIFDRILKSVASQNPANMRDLQSIIRAQSPSNWVPAKGLHWGESLMDGAFENPATPAGIERPIIDAIKRSMQVRGSTYEYWRKSHQVCVTSGQLVPKDD